MQPGSALGTGTDTATTLFAGNGSAADYAGLDAQGKVVVVHRSDEVAPAGARRGSGRRRRGRTDRRQRRHRRAQRVRRRRHDPGRDRPPRRGGDPRRDGEERHEAGPVAAGAHPLRLRPDPRVPGPGPGPAAGLLAAEDRPRQDRRPLLRRPARRRLRIPVRRHPEPVPRLRGAGAPPGHPGGVGDAGPEVGRVARPEHLGCAPVADGVGGQHLRQGRDRPPRLVPTRGAPRLQRLLRRLQLPVGELHDLERPGLELEQPAAAPGWVPALGRDADPPGGVPGHEADPREQVQLRHAVEGGPGGQPSLPGRPGRLAARERLPALDPHAHAVAVHVRHGRGRLLQAVPGDEARLQAGDRPRGRRTSREEAAHRRARLLGELPGASRHGQEREAGRLLQRRSLRGTR